MIPGNERPTPAVSREEPEAEENRDGGDHEAPSDTAVACRS